MKTRDDRDAGFACNDHGAAAQEGRRGAADHRRRGRDGHQRQVRGGGRDRPDRHLQLGPVPHGRTRLDGRLDALRQRQRDRQGDGPRGADRGAAHAGAGRRLRLGPLHAPRPFPPRAQGHGLRRHPELPDGRPDRRHVPRQSRRNRHGLRPGDRPDRRGPPARPATTPYAFDPDQSRLLAQAGADIVVAHMGLTTKGSIGAKTARTLDDCVREVTAIAEAGKSARAICWCSATAARSPTRRTPSTSSTACRASMGSTAPARWSDSPPRSPSRGRCAISWD